MNGNERERTGMHGKGVTWMVHDRSFKSAKKALDVNWGPLSEIILSSSPNHL